MAKRIANSTLNASTIDIINCIRQNAGYEYQQNVPKVEKATDIPKVGEIICGTPAFSNNFLNSLINRIALVRVKSATFNNPYSHLKKGYLEFGETIEEIFVNIANVIEYSDEKAESREFKRTIPDVKSVFHVMNYRAMYPITVQEQDLRQAFLSMDGVQDLISRIVDSIYTAAEYDEFLLFKYMLIKAISHGQMKPVSIGTGENLKESAVKFRSTSNLLPFMKRDFNEQGVLTTSPKDRQAIFMDTEFNAQYDVNVLASAFNMEKTDFMGKLHLIDDWTTFDNERFEVIRANSDGIEEVTAEELTLMRDVKAVLIDTDWFQIYDNNNQFRETQVSSGLYWNYFYHTWKTISHSPFANAIVFLTSTADTELPPSVTVKVTAKDEAKEATILTVQPQFEQAKLHRQDVEFIQTPELTSAGIAVHPYGAVVIPASKHATEITLKFNMGGATYAGATTVNLKTAVGATVTCNQE